MMPVYSQGRTQSVARCSRNLIAGRSGSVGASGQTCRLIHWALAERRSRATLQAACIRVRYAGPKACALRGADFQPAGGLGCSEAISRAATGCSASRRPGGGFPGRSRGEFACCLLGYVGFSAIARGLDPSAVCRRPSLHSEAGGRREVQVHVQVQVMGGRRSGF